MKNILLFILTVLIGSNCFSQEVVVFFFAYESDEVIPFELDQELLIKLLMPPFDSIQLRGHTDDVGSDLFNLQLSKKRVESAKDSLLALNVAEAYIKTSFLGESEPLVDNNSEENRATNRRVEILIYRSETIDESSILPADTIVPDINIDDNSGLYAYLKQASSLQSFSISNLKDTVIATRDGAFIYFPKNSFRTDCETVEIRIEELNDKKAMVLSNVQTVSNDRLIYSDGMMDVRAYCNTQEVDLNSRKKYTMLIPKTLDTKGALGFYGFRDSLTNQVNWEPAFSRELETISGNGNGTFACRNIRSCPVIDWFRSSRKKWERATAQELDDLRLDRSSPTNQQSVSRATVS